jgi:hypothetical protein
MTAAQDLIDVTGDKIGAARLSGSARRRRAGSPFADKLLPPADED